MAPLGPGRLVRLSVTSALPLPPVHRSGRLALPRRPENATPRGFPVLATIAPVVASLALWAVTQSPFALMFAALGPVIAVASMGDSRLQARRLRRRETVRFGADCAAVVEAIAEAHAQERGERQLRHPGAPGLVRAGVHTELWRGSFDAAVPVRLGTGPAPSSLELQSDAANGSSGDEATERRMLELQHAAAVVQGAPIVVDARFGIGIVGAAPLALAAARAVVLQLAAALPPDTTEVRAPNDAAPWQWLGLLPHPKAQVDARQARPVVAFTQLTFTQRAAAQLAPAHAAGTHRSIVVAVASDAALLPREARVVVRVGAGAGGAVVQHPEHGGQGQLQPDFVSAEEAARWALEQQERARAEGIAGLSGSLPESVRLGDLLETERHADHTVGLECALGSGEVGPIRVDLVAAGPHAVVGGTTGSGKSELLVTWVLAMAATRSPAVVTFLFVDFKGGASFEPLRTLPHCVGVITDLDGQETLRALGSLRAEVRYRERMLAQAGYRSVDHAPRGTPFPRLVLVVDEYAAMVAEHPELHPLFTDLAARGRSLGIHLILCTQRPAGAVREGVLANASLRLSLRVNNRADSVAVIGTDAAAGLGSSPLGRAFVSVAGEPPRPVQVALANDSDIEAIAAVWPVGAAAPRRPWCPPLPSVVSFAALGPLEREVGTVPFALADVPAEQRQSAAVFAPARDGHLLVVGASGAGKTGVLRALAAAPSGFRARRAGDQLHLVWDLLSAALVHAGPPTLLLLDDADALVTSCQDDYSAALLDLLSRVLREGPARGVHVVLTMQRIPSPLQPLIALCGSRLLLRMPNRQEHMLAGGDSAAFASALPPGGGHWNGDRVQVVLAPSADGPGRREPARRVCLDLEGPRGLVAVSTQPAAFAGRLRAAAPSRQVVELSPLAGDPRQLLVSAGGQQPVLVADPETWQSHWGAIGALRASADVVFDGCSVAEFRQLTRVREVPPPHAASVRPLWVLGIDGTVARASLEAPTT